MKIIFLDFDGVLNSIENVIADVDGFVELCPVRCKIVARLCKESGAKIVVSSSWRTGHTTESLLRLLADEHPSFACLAPHVIDITTRSCNGHRGSQIAEWLKAHPEVGVYVILDDDSDMLSEQRPAFVQTSMSRGIGLDEYLDALAILAPGHAHLHEKLGLAAYRKAPLRESSQEHGKQVS